MSPRSTPARPNPTTGGEGASAARIHDRMGERAAAHAAAGPEAIDRRLAELVREWDVDRVVAGGAAAVALAGLGLGVAVDRRFLALPALAGGFLLVHVLGGRGPSAALRRRGYRTAAEIGEERTVLKALRGDFHDLFRMSTAADRAEVTRWESEGGSYSGAGAVDAHDQQDQGAVDDALRAARR